ncbi:helix-turn-helix domain-containing protein [Acidithiobacillus ferrivorans]|uniref:helix-turn-helix domain-containing protein n=1 Tax=Acidithiobacillus ferrivorans TaxID=160808 RepID=UPI000B138C15|nr:helix-turn-helix domain-containing protein [Acidithiobacillus ferrivorans]
MGEEEPLHQSRVPAGLDIGTGNSSAAAVFLCALLFRHPSHPDEVVSNEQIADILWGGQATYLAPNILVVKIYRLRKILESAGAKGWLGTVHGFGYRFSPPKNAVARIAPRFIT